MAKRGALRHQKNKQIVRVIEVGTNARPFIKWHPFPPYSNPATTFKNPPHTSRENLHATRQKLYRSIQPIVLYMKIYMAQVMQ